MNKHKRSSDNYFHLIYTDFFSLKTIISSKNNTVLWVYSIYRSGYMKTRSQRAGEGKWESGWFLVHKVVNYYVKVDCNSSEKYIIITKLTQKR